MTEHPEHESEHHAQPAPIRHDGWWDKVIEAVLEELGEPRDEPERGPGR